MLQPSDKVEPKPPGQNENEKTKYKINDRESLANGTTHNVFIARSLLVATPY